MNIYRNLHAKLQPSKDDVSHFSKSLGGKVRKAATLCKWTTLENMREITDTFYDALVYHGWQWTPGKSCGSLESAAKLLDGEMVNAECQVVANAFVMLLTLPEPYGFGAQAKKVTYSGIDTLIGTDKGRPTNSDSKREIKNVTKGFVSRHPLEGIHNLMPNVWDHTLGRLTNLYSWSDHKVVEINGIYWDACYNTSYSLKNEMAVALILGSNISTIKVPVEQWQELVTEDKFLIRNGGQITYLRSTTPNTVPFQAKARFVVPYYESIYGDETAEIKIDPIAW